MGPSKLPVNRASKLFAALMLVVAAACSRPASGGGSNTPSLRPPTPADNRLVLKVEIEGGRVGTHGRLLNLPLFALDRDGRVITPGPQTQIFPGPALPNVIERRVSSEGISEIVKQARQVGLPGKNDLLSLNYIPDAITTRFTLIDGDTRNFLAVYALGEADEAGVPENQREFRRALANFEERLYGLESWLPEGAVGEERPYDFQELTIVVRPGKPTSSEPGIEQPPIEWPLAQPLSELISERFGVGCLNLTGKELDAVLQRARRANWQTPWMSTGKSYSIVFRPLLPDETGASACV